MSDLHSLPVDEVIQQVGVGKAIGIKHVGSVLFSYRCTISCLHCLFSCSPEQPDVCVSLDDGLEFLRQLRATDRVIHIAGGEAMMYYEEMLALCQVAQKENISPHFFETNASWCIDEATTRSRYETLKETGMLGVLISADPYHQAFVPPERRERAFRLGVEIFGEVNVAAGNIPIEDLQDLRRTGRDPLALAEYARRHPPRLVGRAGDALARHMDDRPMESLLDDGLWHGDSPRTRNCAVEFDSQTMWEIHIDPYANIQTCCGIIVGNAKEAPLVEWMDEGFAAKSDLIAAVCEDGPFALLEIAKTLGFEPREGYPQKCNLCWEVRKFLRPHYPETFGPAEIYDYATM